MKNSIIILLSISLSFAKLDLCLANNLTDWNSLNNDNILISYTNFKAFPIVRAKTVIEHPISNIAKIIGNLESYPTVFKRIKEAKKLDDDIVQIIIDMPFPFDGRDYVVKFSIEESENKWQLIYSSVIHPNGKPIDKHIRLPNAAGIWKLKKIDSNKTEATYIWNGELLGNFPDIALDKAWIRWGKEIFDWLNDAL